MIWIYAILARAPAETDAPLHWLLSATRSIGCMHARADQLHPHTHVRFVLNVICVIIRLCNCNQYSLCLALPAALLLHCVIYLSK